MELGEWLCKNPEAHAERVISEFGGNGGLPFLLKVLSVNKALSIQAHPDKDLAEKLHDSDPKHYPDPNHKPEMTIALTDFEGMCGFRVHEELIENFALCPELTVVVGPDDIKAYTQAVVAKAPLEKLKGHLKICFGNLMRADPTLVQTQLKTAMNRVHSKSEEDRVELENLLLRLDQQFPGDVGGFCIFFLNIVHLKPGDAMFLGANEPHAYLDGNCIECMACSDNVVRAGCTPKFKDVDTLIEMLTYEVGSATSKIFRGTLMKDNACVSIYDPPIRDFTVADISAPASSSTSAPVVDSPSIFLCVKGSGKLGNIPIVAGSVCFQPASSELMLEAEEDVKVFRAYC